MRPVTKGNPTTYNQNANGTAVTRTNELQSYIDIIPQSAQAEADFLRVLWKEGVKSQIEYASATGLPYVPKQFAPPGDLLATIVNLRAAFAQALSDKVPQYVLLSIAQQLNDALSLAMAAYEAIPTGTIANVYGTSRADLIRNIGQYCSYCEMPLAASLAVEHKLPKQWFPSRTLNWDNFLLACPICNSRKSANPSVFEGIKAAIAAQQPLPLTQGQIATGASSLYRWPDDTTNYTKFEKTFHYEMHRVLYNLSGKISQTRKFSDNEIHMAVRRNLIRKFDQAGGHIRAEVLTFLFDIKPLLPNDPLAAYLNMIQTGMAPVAINDAGYNANLDALRTAFLNFTSNTIGNYQRFRFDIRTEQNVVITPLGVNRWRLTQTNVYYIDVGATITLYADPGRTLQYQSWITGVKSNRSALAGGTLPYLIAKYIERDPFNVTLTITPLDGNQPSRMEVARAFLLTYQDGVLNVYADELCSVELHLKNAVILFPSNSNPESSRVIAAAGLNEQDINDQRQSDRRVARRTNAWFTAIECYRNLTQAPSIQNSPGLYNALLTMVAQTASFTGFWSVWYWVALAYLTEGQRAPIMALLNHPTYFPGTR